MALPIRLVLAAVLIGASLPAQSVPTPDEFAGFPIGSDGNLVRWERIVDYFHLLDEGSERVVVDEVGKSTNGNPFLLVKISSPKNIARLDEIQATQRRIAHPSGLTETEIDKLAWESPAVVMISCSIHASEVGATQMALELAHRMATEDSPWMRNVLDNVVFLMIPSLNPDGQIIVTDWNNRVKGTPNQWAPLPWLYHPYAGHDNNRDAYMMTQVESRYANKILFQDWFPQVYLDEHQQGNDGMRVFVPPFRNPINPNVDPAIWAEAGQIGFAMYQRLYEAGVTGVGYDQKYTAWWQGGFLRGAWFHNIVGMLTEVASANLAMPVEQERAEIGKPVTNAKTRAQWYEEREKDPNAAMPPPTDLMERYDYPRPWLGGRWTLRDIIDSELALTKALLETAANDRVKLIRTQIRLGLDAIAEGEAGDPYAYVLPAGQHDPGSVYTLLEVLHYAGIEVSQATEPFEADGLRYAAGSYVIPMAQPFRAYAKDLLEPQMHPDPAEMPEGKMGAQPYDLTTWSLPLQMGVEAVPVKDRFQTSLDSLAEIPHPESVVKAMKDATGYVIQAGPNSLATAINRLQRDGVELSRLTAEYAADDDCLCPRLRLGARNRRPPARALHRRSWPAGERPGRRAKRSRPAVSDPASAFIARGPPRWMKAGRVGCSSSTSSPSRPLFDADVESGRLDRLYDVILLPGRSRRCAAGPRQRAGIHAGSLPRRSGRKRSQSDPRLRRARRHACHLGRCRRLRRRDFRAAAAQRSRARTAFQVLVPGVFLASAGRSDSSAGLRHAARRDRIVRRRRRVRASCRLSIHRSQRRRTLPGVEFVGERMDSRRGISRASYRSGRSRLQEGPRHRHRISPAVPRAAAQHVSAFVQLDLSRRHDGAVGGAARGPSAAVTDGDHHVARADVADAFPAVHLVRGGVDDGSRAHSLRLLAFEVDLQYALLHDR